MLIRECGRRRKKEKIRQGRMRKKDKTRKVMRKKDYTKIIIKRIEKIRLSERKR